MALGAVQIPLNTRQYFTVTGGPFRDCPDTMKGVKMAAELLKDRRCAVDIPTEDFQIPNRKLMYRGLTKAVDLMLAGEPLYVGCMGGKGRTGLFLACLAKAAGVKQPIQYVRKHYYSHAVETKDQEKFVRQFTITPTIKRRFKVARRWAWLKFWKTNLTRMPLQSVAQVSDDEQLTEVLRDIERDVPGPVAKRGSRTAQSR